MGGRRGAEGFISGSTKNEKNFLGKERGEQETLINVILKETFQKNLGVTV